MAFRTAAVVAGMSLIVSICAQARDGALDPTFGTGGIGGKVETAYAVAFVPQYVVASILGGVGIQSTGKLVFASSVAPSGSSNFNFGVTRLNVDGSVDFGFGSFGSSIIAFDRSGSSLIDFASDMAVLSDDSIVIAGFVAGDTSTGADFGVLKLSANGQPDNSFGAAGKTIVQFNLDAKYNDDVAASIGTQTDGKLLLGGFASTGAVTVSGQTASMMAIARLTATGERDTSFNSTGRVTIGFGGDVAAAYRVRELADGQHLVAVGYADTVVGAARYTFALVRLNVADGSLDTTFGTSGKTTFDFPFASGNGGATDFVELPDGHLMVCGEVLVNLPNNSDFVCMRFLANGTPDPTYQPMDLPFDLGGDLNDLAVRLQRDSQGRILVAGFAAIASNNSDCAIARLTPTGLLDPTFGNSGRLTFDSRATTGDTDRDNGCYGLALQPDGKIIAAGYAAIDNTVPSADYDLQVIRLIGDTIYSDGFE